MIEDNKTNFLYLADSLKNNKLYPTFFTEFEKLVKQLNIKYDILPGTKDIWAVDYMPIQVQENSFVQFSYKPGYLKTKAELEAISDVDAICKEIKITPIKSTILLDGGNIIKSNNKIIMTERVFKENPTFEKKELIKELEQLLQTDKLVFIPEQPYDFTGHADGMVRFLNDDTVIINDYKDESEAFKKRFYRSLKEAGLNYVEIPYNLRQNKMNSQANGCYINFLQMGNVIIVPNFELDEDEIVEKQFQELFPGQIIATIKCNEIANQGGVLNCISWNILIKK